MNKSNAVKQIIKSILLRTSKMDFVFPAEKRIFVGKETEKEKSVVSTGYFSSISTICQIQKYFIAL